MNFKDILEDWERLSAIPGGLDKATEAEGRLRGEEISRASQRAEASKKAKPTAARESLATWLDQHGTVDKDGRQGPEEAGAGEARAAEGRRLKALKPEATIDLHGLKAQEAEQALEAFLEASSRAGLEKVLVITGKGLHSQGEPILGKLTRRVLEGSPLAGRFGAADTSQGGGGALWVILRPRTGKKDHFSR